MSSKKIQTGHRMTSVPEEAVSNQQPAAQPHDVYDSMQTASARINVGHADTHGHNADQIDDALENTHSKLESMNSGYTDPNSSDQVDTEDARNQTQTDAGSTAELNHQSEFAVEQLKTSATSIFAMAKQMLADYRIYAVSLGKLAEAEGRYAIANVLSLAVLSLLAVVIITVTWLGLCAMIGIAFVSQGLSLFTTIGLLLLLNTILFLVIAWRAKYKLDKIGFKETRAMLSKPMA